MLFSPCLSENLPVKQIVFLKMHRYWAKLPTPTKNAQHWLLKQFSTPVFKDSEIKMKWSIWQKLQNYSKLLKLLSTIL